MTRAVRTGIALALFTAVLALCPTLPQVGAAKAEDGWIPLFNGKDLTGWKMFNPPSGDFKSVTAKTNDDGKVIAYVGKFKKDDKDETLWQVKDGMIVGAGHASHLFSEGGDYIDFSFRVEAKINDKGNSGMYCRTAFGPGFPQGYETQINATHSDPIRTGSLYPAGGLGKYKDKITVMNTASHKADEFFTQEVTAEGARIIIQVNGKQTIDFTDPDNRYKKGHFALQGHDPGTVVTFKKIEYKPIKK